MQGIAHLLAIAINHRLATDDLVRGDMRQPALVDNAILIGSVHAGAAIGDSAKLPDIELAYQFRNSIRSMVLGVDRKTLGEPPVLVRALKIIAGLVFDQRD